MEPLNNYFLSGVTFDDLSLDHIIFDHHTTIYYDLLGLIEGLPTKKDDPKDLNNYFSLEDIAQ